jgi:subtilisin family serine protease
MFNKLKKALGLIVSVTAVRSTAVAGLLLLTGLCLVNSQGVRSEVSLAVAFRARQVIVELKPGSPVDAVNIRNDTTTIKRLPGTDFYLLQVAAEMDESASVTQLKSDVSVVDASLNRVVESPFTSLSHSIMSFPDGYAVPGQPPTEYQLQKQALEGQLNLTAAHVRSRGAGTTVAVVDTGIDRTHPDLNGRLWIDDRDRGDIPDNGIDDDLDGLVDDAYGWDLVDGDGDPTELPDDPMTTVAGHGTFIAGLIAILAPDCRIMPIRAFTPPGESDEFTVAEAIKWATDHGADVINMSFGTPVDSSILFAAIEYAFQQEVVLVAALGNEASDTPPLYPAFYHDQVMGVTAVDAIDKLAFFSNYGSHTSMSALGRSIISTYPGAGYALWSGTSFSTPLAGAEAALLISADHNSRVTRQVMEQTALNIDGLNGGFAGLIGEGRVRPLNALKALNTNVTLNPTVDLQSRIELTAGGPLPNAKGAADVSVTGTVHEVRIRAYRLTPGSAYRLVINGQAQPGSFTAAAFGNIEAVMSTSPGVHAIPLPAAFQPVTRVDRVELRDGAGGLVLAGDFDSVVGTAKPEQTVLKEARLSAVPLSSLATALYTQVTTAGPAGLARVEVDSEHQVLRIGLETSTTNGAYNIMIDGVSIGAVTSHFGSVSVAYSNPAAILPLCNVRQITIVDSLGRIVAQGTFRIPGAGLGTG